MVIVLGIQKKSEKCFNLSSFCDGGLVGFWVGFQRLFWVQLSALDGVAVNPILFLLLFRPYNGILSFKNRHIFFIFWPPAPPMSCYLEKMCYFETDKKIYVKTPSGLNLISGKKKFSRLHRWNDATFGLFRIFP